MMENWIIGKNKMLRSGKPKFNAGSHAPAWDPMRTLPLLKGLTLPRKSMGARKYLVFRFLYSTFDLNHLIQNPYS
jgi:hypothetical protein